MNCRGTTRSVISVPPGAIALMRMPWRPYSIASTLVSARMPPLLVA